MHLLHTLSLFLLSSLSFGMALPQATAQPTDTSLTANTTSDVLIDIPIVKHSVDLSPLPPILDGDGNIIELQWYKPSW
jgi:hypothetical protein